MNESEIVKYLIKHIGRLKESRQYYDNVNQRIAQLVRQNSKDFSFKRNPGEREDEEIFDTTATRAAQTLASILQSRLITPGEKWVKFKHPDKELMKNDDVKRFYESLSDDFYNITKNSESQFYQKCHELFLDLPSFGTGAMFITKDLDKNIIFELRRLQEIYCEENNHNIIDCLYREFELTARQAYQEFKEESIGPKVLKDAEGNPSKKTTYYHIVIPEEDYSRMIGGTDKGSQYKSLYISTCDNKIVKESFFNDKPFVVARWSKRAGEVYGIGAAWDVLSDIEVLNLLSMLELEAAELSIRPPLLATDEGVIGEPEWIPGGITYGAITEDGKRLLQEFTSSYDISKGILAKQERIKNIESAFFVDQFREREGVQPLTATEAMQNQEKMLALLSPQTKRIEDELLAPLCLRTISLRLEDGDIPIPEVLKTKDNKLEIELEFLSPLSFSRRTAEITKYNLFLQNVFPIIQAHPEGLDNFDLDRIERDIAEKSGIPLDYLRKEKDVKAMRTQRAEQQMQQQQLLNLETGASAAEKLSKIE